MRRRGDHPDLTIAIWLMPIVAVSERRSPAKLEHLVVGEKLFPQRRIRHLLDRQAGFAFASEYTTMSCWHCRDKSTIELAFAHTGTTPVLPG